MILHPSHIANQPNTTFKKTKIKIRHFSNQVYFEKVTSFSKIKYLLKTSWFVAIHCILLIYWSPQSRSPPIMNSFNYIITVLKWNSY